MSSSEDLAQFAESARPVVVYKHSPTCGASDRAFTEVQAFSRAHPDAPVFVVDVLAQRALSFRLAAQFGIGHESPQVIVLNAGVATWNESHFGISAQRIAAACAVARLQVNAQVPADG